MALPKEGTENYNRMDPKRTRALTVRQENNVRANATRETSKIVNRLVAQANGELTKPLRDDDGKLVLDENGDKIMVEYHMNASEIRAAEIILNKTLPNLTAQQIVEDDPTNHMGRDEIIEMLGSILVNNPKLAQLSGLTSAVDEINTVVTIDGKKK